MDSRPANDIQFISYDGEYPNLCSGTLVYSVNGVEHSVRYGLSSGGRVWFSEGWDEHIESGEWSLHSADFPDLDEEGRRILTDLVNANVRQGCCGGCV